jgi:hypothetical protein
VAQRVLPRFDVRARYVVVVRRGETRLFQELQSSLDRWPEGTAVVWDRRHADRRTVVQEVSIERRRRQRRAEPDSMWYSHGFVVVEATEPPEESSQDASIG